MSDHLDLIQIEKFKNSVSVSDDQCLKYVRKQCLLSEDIIFTVHIGYDCLQCLCMDQSENVYYKNHRRRAVPLQSVESKLGRTGEGEMAERETGERREEEGLHSLL